MPTSSQRVQTRPAETPETGWSLRVGTVLGIPIRVHFTFVLLLFYFGFLAASEGGSVTATLVFVLAVFTCVVLHELGHATMARAYGVGTREIVLYPIGGIARLETIPTGLAELLIALAGPAVNLVLAPLLVGLMVVLRVPLLPAAPGVIGSLSDVLPHLLIANGMLFLFNLIPAFPMDGGRALRALLTLTLPADRATRIAAAIGQAIAVAMGAWGLAASQPMLLFIALFVFLGAAQEAAFFRRRAAVEGRAARAAMIREFETLAPNDSLAHAAERLLATHQQDFPVVDAWRRVAGILTRNSLLRGLAQHGNGAAVLDAMQRDFKMVPPDTDLGEVLRLLQASPGAPVLVHDGGALLGMITLDNLAEFVELSRFEAPR
jgi:stage IV sporulation protein FB